MSLLDNLLNTDPEVSKKKKEERSKKLVEKKERIKKRHEEIKSRRESMKKNRAEKLGSKKHNVKVTVVADELVEEDIKVDELDEVKTKEETKYIKPKSRSRHI